MSEVVLRNRNCRACGFVFCVCSHCDRGQCYCSQECRREARRQQLRARPIDVTSGRTQAADCIKCASATIGGGGPGPA